MDATRSGLEFILSKKISYCGIQFVGILRLLLSDNAFTSHISSECTCFSSPYISSASQRLNLLTSMPCHVIQIHCFVFKTLFCVSVLFAHVCVLSNNFLKSNEKKNTETHTDRRWIQRRICLNTIATNTTKLATAKQWTACNRCAVSL